MITGGSICVLPDSEADAEADADSEDDPEDDEQPARTAMPSAAVAPMAATRRMLVVLGMVCSLVEAGPVPAVV
jgi:hypothetical protein